MTWQERYLARFYNRDRGWVDGTTEFWALCEAAIPRGSLVLEIGAGPSNPTSRFLATLGRLDAVDIDPAVYGNDAAHEKMILESGRIPAPDASYDACVSNFVLEHVDIPDTHLSEIRRVLKPSGVYVFRTPNQWHYVALAARATPQWFHHLVANRLRSRPAGSPEPYETFHRLNSRRALEKAANRLGFDVGVLRLIEKEPSYGMSSRALFLAFAGYERIVNAFPLLEGLRCNILGVLSKSSER